MTKISDLTAASVALGTEQIPYRSGGTNGSLTVQQIGRAPTGKPIFILASGQSNFVLTPAYSWTPNPNAKIWNNTINTDGSVGTAFAALSSTTINIAHKIASDIADANPTRPVFLLDVAFNNKDISYWLVGAAAPDVYQNILNNITAALAAAGVSKIDMFAWWQGEADAVLANNNYPTNFATVMNRFWGNSWFPKETPVMVHGLDAIYGSYSSLLLGVVNTDPDKRRFVNTNSLNGSTYWDATNPGHMTAQGYFSAGAMSARAFLNGPGRNSLQSVIVDPVNGYINFGQIAIPSDPFVFNFNGQVANPGSTGFVMSTYGPNGGPLNTGRFSFGSNSQNITQRANGSYLAPTKLLAEDIIDIWAARGYDSAGLVVGNKAALFFGALGDWTAPNHGTWLDLYLTPSGSDATAKVLRFQSDQIKISGVSSGVGTLTWPAVLGTPTWTLPTNTGTFAVSATSPLVLNATTGNLTLTGGNLPATATNDSAAAGNVGEYIESVIASGSAVSLVTATAKNITSIALTAGDWDVDGIVNFLPAATTVTLSSIGSLSTTTNTLDTTAGRDTSSLYNGVTSTLGHISQPIPNYRFSLSATTTIYLVAQSSFNTSTMTGYGIIRARRAR